MLKNTRPSNSFVSILSDGTMRVAAEEGAEGAVKREYETSDGKTGSKWEYVYTELTGKITNVSFYEGDYGKLIQLTVEDEESDPVVLSVNTSSNFGEDIMKKLPSIDLEEPVTLAPYSFEDDKGKKKRGVTITQNGEKLKNFYYDEEKKKNLHGFPEVKLPKGKKPTKDFWKLYFLEARMFLIDETEKRFVKAKDDYDGL